MVVLLTFLFQARLMGHSHLTLARNSFRLKMVFVILGSHIRLFLVSSLGGQMTWSL